MERTEIDDSMRVLQYEMEMGPDDYGMVCALIDKLLPGTRIFAWHENGSGDERKVIGRIWLRVKEADMMANILRTYDSSATFKPL